MQTVREAAQSLAAVRQEGFGGVERRTRFEVPAERLGVDAQAKPRRVEGVDLDLGQEVAAVRKDCPIRLAGGLRGIGALQDEHRVLLMTGRTAEARHRVTTGRQGPDHRLALAGPRAAEVDDVPVRVGQVE